ncbi:hypothetical protein [Nonomuraea fuscirosea]|uniref:hypothetical protein n=1 Tax=Nonomuraea fuscirosea TaxID=1291556 RepID=UPI00344787C2
MRDKPNGAGDRVGVYVDGFNLYYGLKHPSGRRDLWLDLAGLARELLRQRASPVQRRLVSPRAGDWFPLGQAMVRRCQFPDTLTVPGGHVYRRPPYWN